MGVKHVEVVDAFDVDKLTKVVKEEVARDEVSVIISQSPCALLKSFVPKENVIQYLKKCVKCGQCLVPGCPAMTKKEDGTVAIDGTMVTAVDFAWNCKFGAIELKRKENNHGRNKEYYDSRRWWSGVLSYQQKF